MSVSAPTNERIGDAGMQSGDRHVLPIWLRIGVLAIVLWALFAALTGEPVSGVEQRSERGQALVSRPLFFVDGTDGSVRILDANSNLEIERLAVGEDGFTRSLMRGLARTRKAQGLDATRPFLLAAHADGRLYIDDPATGEQVVLSAFGPDNVAAFARLLPDAE